MNFRWPICFFENFFSELETMELSKKDAFTFRHFTINQDRCAMKVGIDAVVLGAWTPVNKDYKRVLDIGAGTGILSLLLAQRLPEAMITAVEIDPEAASQTQENADNSPFKDRIKVVASSIQEAKALEEKGFDLIICNPPFFTGGVLSDQLNRNTARHTVKLSHADLLASVRRLLAPDGRFSLVLPKIEALRFREIAAGLGFYPREVLQLRPRADKPVHRVLQSFGKGKSDIDSQELTQYEEGQEWTTAFKALVAPYYLD